MRVKGRTYTEAEQWHFTSAIFILEKQGGSVRTGSTCLTINVTVSCSGDQKVVRSAGWQLNVYWKGLGTKNA
jgi:hypothetical protein